MGDISPSLVLDVWLCSINWQESSAVNGGVHVRIVSEPYGERIIKTTWICDRCCRPYWEKECIRCYCKIFPQPIKPFTVEYPKTGKYEDHKKWDVWYIEFFVMEPLEDPELIYEIGGEELIWRQHQKESYKKMTSAPKRIKSVGFVCKHCKVRFIKN